MAIQKTRGIVLRTRDYSETSKLVTFITPDWGRLNTLAKGARRPKSKLRGKLELFNYGILVFYPSRTSDLHLLSQFDLLNDFPRVSESLEKTAYFYYLTELVSSAGYGEEESRKLFTDLREILSRAGEIASISYARLWFEFKFLESLGVLPIPGRCCHCGAEMKQQVLFSPRERGWICGRCRSRDRQAFLIEPGVMAVIGYILRGGLERGEKLKLSAVQERTLNQISRYLVDSNLGKKIKSRRFLDQIISSFKSDRQKK